MITGFFISIINGAVGSLIGLLPLWDLPAGISSSLSLLWSYVNMFSFLFPVGTLLTVLGLALLYHGIFLLFDMVMWLIKFIRGV